MKKYSHAFTLIELLITIAIIGITAAIALPVFMGNSSASYGYNGVVEDRCQSGFKTIVGQNGHVQQLLDQNGHGIPCN